MKRRKLPTGSPEELRDKAARCAAKALAWLKRGAEFERAARRAERKRDLVMFPWPCKCGAFYATEKDLQDHQAGNLAPKCIAADTPQSAGRKARAARAVADRFAGLALRAHHEESGCPAKKRGQE